MFKCERCKEEFDYKPYEIYGDCFCSECALENLIEEVREPSMCRKFLCWVAKTKLPTGQKYDFIDDIALSTDEEVVNWVEEDATVEELMEFFEEEM